MQILFYLLEANLYLVMLYSFYRAILHRETFHQLNRWCLLVAILLAFAAPLMKVNYGPALTQKVTSSENTIPAGHLQPIKSADNSTHQQFDVASGISPEIKADKTITKSAVSANPMRVLLVVYLLVTILYLLSTLSGLLRIIKIYKRSPKFRLDGVTHVLLEKDQEAYSFFNWLFYHPAIQTESAIIAHELVHIKQKHSLDLLFFDLIRAISWFNPVLYMMRKDLKLNHEYLADEQASGESVNRYAYALLLIDHSSSKVKMAITHQMFDARQLKARILRLGKQRSTNNAKLKYTLALPLLAVILGLSSFTISKDYALLNLSVMNRSATGKDDGLSSVPNIRIAASRNSAFATLASNQKTNTLPSQALVVKKGTTVSGSRFVEDTVPRIVEAPPSADSLRRKWWAPQPIRDSVQKYESAASRLIDSMRNDGQRVMEIIKLMQKESSEHYLNADAATTSGNNMLYESAGRPVADQATKDRIASIDHITSRIKENYGELRRLIQLSNTFRSEVRDSFPMYVSKLIAKLSNYQSSDGIKIPAPDMRYRSAWVNNETERLVFFETSD